MPAAAARRLTQAQIEARRARWRRFSGRAKAGIAIAPTPYTADTVDTLFRLHYLQNEYPTPQQVGAAIAAAIATLERHLKNRAHGFSG